MKRIAVIDLGSNSVRMSIFDRSTPERALHTFRSTIRLSQGMTADGVLKAEPQMRAVNALLEYKRIITDEGVDTVCAVATAAVRKAKNQAEFLSLVNDLTGIKIQVIDGFTEARLDSLAISRMLDCPGGVICDIGGGSTELIGICDGPPPIISIPHGCRGICEMFFAQGESPELVKSAQAFADKLICDVDWLDNYKGATLVGIGGTIHALAKFDLCHVDKSTITKSQLSLKRMYEILNEVESAGINLRRQMPGIGAERADIILGGIILLRAVLGRIFPDKILVSDAGIREGVFFDLIENNGILQWCE